VPSSEILTKQPSISELGQLQLVLLDQVVIIVICSFLALLKRLHFCHESVDELQSTAWILVEFY